MKTKLKYFSSGVLRTPLYPLKDYTEIAKTEAEIDAFVKARFRDPVFKEAVYLASPELYYEWEKAFKNLITSPKARAPQSRVS